MCFAPPAREPLAHDALCAIKISILQYPDFRMALRERQSARGGQESVVARHIRNTCAVELGTNQAQARYIIEIERTKALHDMLLETSSANTL